MQSAGLMHRHLTWMGCPRPILELQGITTVGKLHYMVHM